MHWIPLTSLPQLEELAAASYHKPIAIYKHSTRCSISVMVKKSLEMEWNIDIDKLPIYYLDLLNYRPVSDRVVELFSVYHESPQLILIKDGKAIYHASHSEINYDEVVKAA